jgi:hypothetical protein
VWAICAYSFVTPKLYIEGIRAKVPLESRVSMEHNAKKNQLKI